MVFLIGDMGILNRLMWVVLLSLGSSCAVFAKVELLDGGSGLSSNSITAIVKDKRGLMWIGTQNGLNIYAGYTFTRPYSELSNEYITHIAYDSVRNTVWVGTWSGLYLITPDNGAVQRIVPETDVQDNGVEALCIVPHDAVYVVYRDGVVERVDHQYNSRFFLRLAYHMAPRLVAGGSESLWFISSHKSGGELCTTTAATQQSSCIDLPHSENVAAGYISTLLRYKDSLTIIRRGRRVLLLRDGLLKNVTPRELSARNIEMVTLSGDKLLLVVCGSYCSPSKTAEDTLLVYDLKTGVTRHVPTRSEIFFGRQRYFSAYEDESDIIWVGTNRGLYKILPERHLFDTVLYDDQMRISTRSIIKEPNGDMYVGSSDGLYYYSAQTATWMHWQYQDPETRKAAVQITALLDDPEYVYVSGFHVPAFYRFSKRTRQFEACIASSDYSPGSSYALFRDQAGTIWVGMNGLAYYDTAARKLVRISDSVWKSPPPFPNVLNIQQGSAPGTLWLATNNGVYLFHTKDGIMQHFHKKSEPALSANEVYFIHEDNNRRLWLGTNGGGVNVISADRTRVVHFSKDNKGLSSDIVYGMLRQRDGKCWFSTSNGLSCYDPQQNRFYNFYTTDGLCNNDFNYNSYLYGNDGRMYFGSVNGLIAFRPEEMVTAERSEVRLFVLPVSRWDEQTKTFTLIDNFRGDGDQIVLNSPNASLVFNLGLTDYTDPVHNVFTYRILGLFDDWVPLSGEPVLRLHGIPYGKYTLEINGITTRGGTAANQLRFFIHVKKPFYNTIWFYLVLGGSLLVFISLFFSIKYSNLKRMHRLRMQISSNLHDEVGSLLTSITLFSDNLRFSGSIGEEKDMRLQRIAALSREAVGTMGDILWAVDARNDVQGSLSQRMREYAEELLLPLQVTLHIEVEEKSSRHIMPILLRQQLYLIFKEAVNNVVKHAQVTTVTIALYYHDEYQFVFGIVNDGVVSAKQGVQGQGLTNIAMRAKMIGAEVSHQRRGSQFRLVVKKGAITWRCDGVFPIDS